jgi:hypothetical protein
VGYPTAGTKKPAEAGLVWECLLGTQKLRLVCCQARAQKNRLEGGLVAFNRYFGSLANLPPKMGSRRVLENF